MVAVFVVDGDRRCRFANAVAEALTGISSAQARDRALADVLWRNNTVPFSNSALARALEGGAGEGEENLTGADGKRRPVAFRVVPLGPALLGGAVVELVDLSGETGTGRALRVSEQRLRLAVEATGIGIWDVDVATGRRRWSAEMCAILGLPVDATADQDTFSALIHPDDRAAIDAAYENAYRSPQNGSFDSEFRVRRKNDGAERWVAISGKVSYDASGQPIRGVGTIRDIHDRRLAEETLRDTEERYRLATEANDVGTWDLDMLSGEHRWSPTFKRLWGLPADAPSEPKVLYPLVADSDWVRIRETWKAAWDPAGGGRLSLQYEIRRANDGARRWFSFAGRVLFDQRSKKPIRALGIVTDVTERQQVEERQRLVLREMNHRVKNSLALVQAIVWQTIRMTPDPKVAFERIQSRIMSLARTHDFLNQGDRAGVSLQTLIAGEFAPFVGHENQVALDGPPVMLDSSAVFALGLTFHELAANAVKHGALSAVSGRVSVDWLVTERDGKPRLAINWRERGGPPVTRVRRVGFGSRLIEVNLRSTLGGDVETKYAKAGLTCSFSFPLRPVDAEDVLPEQAASYAR